MKKTIRVGVIGTGAISDISDDNCAGTVWNNENYDNRAASWECNRQKLGDSVGPATEDDILWTRTNRRNGRVSSEAGQRKRIRYQEQSGIH